MKETVVFLKDDMTESKRREAVNSIITCLELVPEKKIKMILCEAERHKKITPYFLRNVVGLEGYKLDSAYLLFQNTEYGASALTLGLEAAIGVRHFEKKRYDDIELCWTGPSNFSVVGRSNKSAAEEIIGNSAKRIIVVGYSITKKSGKLIGLLNEKLRQGVSVMIVFHKDEKKKNETLLSQVWKKGPRPEFYTRMPKNKKDFFKIHAKMIVADSSVALITSANFTLLGMSKNFEIGVLVKGKTAKKADTLIRSLIKKKYLNKWEISP